MTGELAAPTLQEIKHSLHPELQKSSLLQSRDGPSEHAAAAADAVHCMTSRMPQGNNNGPVQQSIGPEHLQGHHWQQQQ
jgi:hypothetical protein